MKVVGKSGIGLFPAPAAVASGVQQQYEVEAVGELDGVADDVEGTAAVAPAKDVGDRLGDGDEAMKRWNDKALER